MAWHTATGPWLEKALYPTADLLSGSAHFELKRTILVGPHGLVPLKSPFAPSLTVIVRNGPGRASDPSRYNRVPLLFLIFLPFIFLPSNLEKQRQKNGGQKDKEQPTTNDSKTETNKIKLPRSGARVE
jgi:hypothetical protein